MFPLSWPYGARNPVTEPFLRERQDPQRFRQCAEHESGRLDRATHHADLPAEFEKYAYTPDEPVTFTYDQLKGTVETWVDDWARQIATK